MTVATDWYADLVAGWMPGDTVRLKGSRERAGPEHPDVREYYRVKYEAARRIGARSICEIGVRAGYSALAMLSACPDAEYLGIDSGDPAYDTAFASGDDLAAHARRTLSQFPNARLVRADSQVLAVLPPPMTTVSDAWDLVHVDGDHSYAGCLSDLRLCGRDRAVRAVLVDDTDYISAVRTAVEQFIDETGCDHEWLPDPLRGQCLIRLR